LKSPRPVKNDRESDFSPPSRSTNHQRTRTCTRIRPTNPPTRNASRRNPSHIDRLFNHHHRHFTTRHLPTFTHQSPATPPHHPTPSPTSPTRSHVRRKCWRYSSPLRSPRAHVLGPVDGYEAGHRHRLLSFGFRLLHLLHPHPPTAHRTME
jgi:hypothetical protein